MTLLQHRAADGRESPEKTGKATRLARLRELEAEHPEWTNAQYVEALDVRERTVQNYRAELQQEREGHTP